jgi:mannose-6-phosphate isomerase-like protein (cupin superfamily)
MKIWREKKPEGFTPPAHFGGLKVTNIVPFGDGEFSVQVSKAPPGAGGEMHHHDSWSQVFFVLEGELTFDTHREQFTLYPGESVLFEPKDPHATLNEGKTDSVSLVFTVKHEHQPA